MIIDLNIKSSKDLINTARKTIETIDNSNILDNIIISIEDLNDYYSAKKSLAIYETSVNKLEIGYKQKNYDLIISVCEDLNIDTENLLVDMVTVGEEGLFSTIGNIIKKIIEGLFKVVMAIINFIINFITAIIKFIGNILGLGSKGGSGGGSAIPTRSETKALKKEVISDVKQQLEDLTKEVSEKTKIDDAKKIIKDFVENLKENYIRKYLDAFPLKYYSFLKDPANLNIDDPTLINISVEFIEYVMNQIGEHANTIKTSGINPTYILNGSLTDILENLKVVIHHALEAKKIELMKPLRMELIAGRLINILNTLNNSKKLTNKAILTNGDSTISFSKYNNIKPLKTLLDSTDIRNGGFRLYFSNGKKIVANYTLTNDILKDYNKELKDYVDKILTVPPVIAKKFGNSVDTKCLLNNLFKKTEGFSSMEKVSSLGDEGYDFVLNYLNLLYVLSGKIYDNKKNSFTIEDNFKGLESIFDLFNRYIKESKKILDVDVKLLSVINLKDGDIKKIKEVFLEDIKDSIKTSLTSKMSRDDERMIAAMAVFTIIDKKELLNELEKDIKNMEKSLIKSKEEMEDIKEELKKLENNWKKFIKEDLKFTLEDNESCENGLLRYVGKTLFKPVIEFSDLNNHRIENTEKNKSTTINFDNEIVNSLLLCTATTETLKLYLKVNELTLTHLTNVIQLAGVLATDTKTIINLIWDKDIYLYALLLNGLGHLVMQEETKNSIDDINKDLNKLLEQVEEELKKL